MATNKKGKTSKSAKKKVVVDYVKKERPKKKILYIELTDSILAEVMKESGMVEVFRNKKILRVEKCYGKNYLILDNTEEINPI